jgi:phosphatidylinositol alpha-mannosyltransferase
LDRENFDVLHIYGPLGPVLPLLSLALSKTVNIGNFHTQFDRSIAYTLTKPLLRKYFRNLHGKIAVSRAARDSFARYFPGDYRLIPIGVDVRRFSPDRPRIAGLSTKDRTILFVGRLDPRKGLEYLLRAFPLILRDHPSTRVIVVGGGRLPRQYRDNMDPEVAARVDFVGMVPPETIPSYYASCDLYCSPAVGKESFGIVLLEAMASGIPVVASDIDGYREVISHGKDGILVKPGDPQAIARAVSDLLANTDARLRLGHNGRSRALQLSWEKVTRQIEDYYFETREKVAWSSTH